MKNILVLLLLVLPECIWAQSYSVKKLGAMEGLSNNNVLSIAQDKQGYLWFATEEGLNKFDGVHFISYYKDIPDKLHITGNELNCLLDDPIDSILWIGTQRAGLNAYNYSNNPYALINLINMDLHERKYEEAYEKLLKLKQNLIFNKDCKYYYDAISVFLNSKLDKKINVKQSVGYHERQLEEYDKTCALTHIFRHVYQDIYNKNIHTVFANNIDVEYLFNNVPNMLNEDNYFYTNIFDEYYLNINNVGVNGENYLTVGCIPGTKDIVSMYPTKYNPIKKVRV